MGLFKLLATPVSAPMDFTLWIARKIRDAAIAELNDPNAIKREIAKLERQLDAGEITEDEYEEAELALLMRLKDIQAGGGAR